MRTTVRSPPSLTTIFDGDMALGLVVLRGQGDDLDGAGGQLVIAKFLAEVMSNGVSRSLRFRHAESAVCAHRRGRGRRRRLEDRAEARDGIPRGRCRDYVTRRHGAVKRLEHADVETPSAAWVGKTPEMA